MGLRSSELAEKSTRALSPRELLLEAPLYETTAFATRDWYGVFESNSRMDGHCPFCRRPSTFFAGRQSGQNFTHNLGSPVFITQQLICARDQSHVVTVFLRREGEEKS